MELLGKKRRTLFRPAVALMLAALALCALLGVSAWAAEEGPPPADTPPGAGDGIPLVQYVNVPNDTPDLYVKKTVNTAAEGYEIPDNVVFRFTIKVGESFYGDQEYRVFAADGSEVFNEAEGTVIPFKTDINGGFTLRGGQTAMFPFVGTGKQYEITEQLPDGSQFMQTHPTAGGAAVGVVEPKGSTAEFVNTYVPVEEKETTTIHVHKDTSFPEGFTPPETPSFTFKLTVDGKPMANVTYMLTSGEAVEGDGTTDGEGRFTLKGGQTASFQDIPVGVDYIVEELLDVTAADEDESPDEQGWRLTGATGDRGATKAPLTVASFTNDIASFAVSKRLDGEPPSETPKFTYFLTDHGGTGIVADYYLYDSATGKPVDDPVKTYETGADGRFTLQPGQTAVFVGVDPGTPYSVREQSQKGFVQTLPETPAGYTGMTVRGDTVETWPFVNTVSEATGSLSVTKTVKSSHSGDMTKEFNFTVRLEDTGFNEKLGDVQFENGVAKFQLKHGETKIIEGLPAGMAYQVTEEEANQNGYTTTITNDMGTIPEDNTVAATFVNQVTDYIVPLTGGPGVHAAWASLAAIAVGCAVLLAARAKTRRKQG